MNVLISTEYRFDRMPDAAVWRQAAFTYHIWTRYLKAKEYQDDILQARRLAFYQQVRERTATWPRTRARPISL